MWQIAFQVIPVLAWGVSALVVVRPLALPRRSALLAIAALGVAFGKFAFFAIAGGNGFTPILPPLVIWSYGCVYGAAMLLTMLSFAAALFDGAAGAFHRPVSVRVRRVRCLVLVAVAAAVALWGIWEGVRTPQVRSVEIACPGLPQSFDGYRIVHLSDLHCSPSARRVRFEKIVRRVNALKPDLVAITGDFVDGTVADRRGDLSPLADLCAKDGVFGCTGNHEAYWECERWLAALNEMGVAFPEKAGAAVIRRGGDALAVGALADPAVRMWLMGLPEWGAAADAFAGAPAGAFRILLFHRPVAELVDSAGADVRLQLSGHTHGGAMPVLRTIIEHRHEGHSRGIYEFAPGRFLHVSPGTGQWAGFPLRLFTPAEITELVLRAAPPGVSPRRAAP